ncbi:GNAT family N-acetyltransferase [Saccharopolyspora halophila]|uniref:GNAT family N-acetyltransferase n=2 Tax=Saccharopolyspora halophila TaxID=405551 RepID=A0ABN3GC85_9PSEU
MGLPPIRPAKEGDLPALQDVERSAGELFAEIGMDFVAEDAPPTIEVLRGFAADGRAWVSTDRDDRPVAYLLVEIVDGNAHLDQVSVARGYAGRGIGRALLEHLIEWAQARRLPAVTLTTYVVVPWNGPYYERLGFRYLRPAEETPGLRKIRADEVAYGLDRSPRACMRKEVC